MRKIIVTNDENKITLLRTILGNENVRESKIIENGYDCEVRSELQWIQIMSLLDTTKRTIYYC